MHVTRCFDTWNNNVQRIIIIIIIIKCIYIAPKSYIKAQSYSKTKNGRSSSTTEPGPTVWECVMMQLNNSGAHSRHLVTFSTLFIQQQSNTVTSVLHCTSQHMCITRHTDITNRLLVDRCLTLNSHIPWLCQLCIHLNLFITIHN